MANLRQKSSKERSELVRYGSSSLARKILPLLSGMEKAINQTEGEMGTVLSKEQNDSSWPKDRIGI